MLLFLFPIVRSTQVIYFGASTSGKLWVDNVWQICQTPFVFRTEKEIVWVTAALKDFKKFPMTARGKILSALNLAAEGEKAEIAKPYEWTGSGYF